jgi:hypothetical protein
MLKDIEFKKVDDLGIAIVREEVEGVMAWVAYLVNFGDSKKDNILVNSYGYGEIQEKPFKTSELRWFMGDLDARTFAKIEELQDDILPLTNEFFVTFYAGHEIFEKKFIFVPESIIEENLTDIPVLHMKGVLIK